MAIAPSFVAVAAGGGVNGIAPSLPFVGRLCARRLRVACQNGGDNGFPSSCPIRFAVAPVFVAVGAGEMAFAPSSVADGFIACAFAVATVFVAVGAGEMAFAPSSVHRRLMKCGADPLQYPRVPLQRVDQC